MCVQSLEQFVFAMSALPHCLAGPATSNKIKWITSIKPAFGPPLGFVYLHLLVCRVICFAI